MVWTVNGEGGKKEACACFTGPSPGVNLSQNHYCHDWQCSWHQMSRGQLCCSMPCSGQASPSQRITWPQVHSAEGRPSTRTMCGISHPSPQVSAAGSLIEVQILGLPPPDQKLRVGPSHLCFNKHSMMLMLTSVLEPLVESMHSELI